MLLSDSNVPKRLLHVQSYIILLIRTIGFFVVFTLSAIVAKKLLGESAVRRDLRIQSNKRDIY